MSLKESGQYFEKTQLFCNTFFGATSLWMFCDSFQSRSGGQTDGLRYLLTKLSSPTGIAANFLDISKTTTGQYDTDMASTYSDAFTATFTPEPFRTNLKSLSSDLHNTF